MLTSESEVDERLRKMNEEFLRSLVGLGGAGSGSGSGSGGSRAASGESSNTSTVRRRRDADSVGEEEVIGRMDFES